MIGFIFGDLMHLKLRGWVVGKLVLVNLGLLVLVQQKLVVLDLGPNLAVYLKLRLTLNLVHVVLMH